MKKHYQSPKVNRTTKAKKIFLDIALDIKVMEIELELQKSIPTMGEYSMKTPEDYLFDKEREAYLDKADKINERCEREHPVY